MRNWTGAALFLIGVWLVCSGLRHRARVRRLQPFSARFGLAPDPTPATSSLAALGEILRPLILFALGYFALKVTVAYLLLDRGRYFSPFDLAGLLFMLASYGTWLVLRTKFREGFGPDGRQRSSIAPDPVAPVPEGVRASPATRPAAASARRSEPVL